MGERGFFAVDRGIWEHDLFVSAEPFSKREAWLWLISEAAWKPCRRVVLGRPFDLQRGQLVASGRFLAAKWRWSEPRVRRLTHELVRESMVDAKTDAGVTVITICNYEDYQGLGQATDAMRKMDDDAEATQRPTQERTNNNLTKEDITADAVSTNGKVYAYESGIVRLTEKSLRTWEGAFAHLDVRAELIGMDRWAQDQGPNWFHAVSGALAKRNREAKHRLDCARAGAGRPLTPDGNPWPEGII